ncbi:glutathione S-transferase N-terminal domain-containing protein [Skermanella pratensis]|uniref:glutathione S-transferase N-terminal domain-containing protein n=1 Tax=Skermanella pratensis TaxID=2233999 RepID=UPI001300F4AD|nr:glutathione S-transferase N-terminal domain-containing protein [Skermanella pratensis]
MKLRYSATSPYVRKVMMVIHELGLADRVELEKTDAWSPETNLPDDNPLGKVPALVVEGGTALFDSPVICEYLDSLASGGEGRLFPPPGAERWAALRFQALADGICDAAILRRLEGNRPEQFRSSDWMERQRRAVARSLDQLEKEADRLGTRADIGALAVLAALGYLDFRFGHEDWRQGRPALSAWFDQASARGSFAATKPPAA